MRAYQEEYLALYSASAKGPPPLGEEGPAAFRARLRSAAAGARAARERGSVLLRKELFPVLDSIHTAGEEELQDLELFAAKLTALRPVPDAALSYRIHMALMSYARRFHRRDMLIRQLYLAAMDLFYLENYLGPSGVRLYRTRMRMYFSQCAAYFETDYDEIQDPETRGYIHRAMGNIALGYDGRTEESAQKKLAAIDRSLRLLNDPELRAKTPSLPWELYVYKSHQERTTMLSYLRSGGAEADVFAQVLESAQFIEQQQRRAAMERGEPLQPRWQYAYLAARYHCGALLLPELLDGLYGLSTARDSGDYSAQSRFCHVSIPAVYITYASESTDERLLGRAAVRMDSMLKRMFHWIAGVPKGSSDDQLAFYLMQLVYAYEELPGCMSYLELLRNILAICHPGRYVRARFQSRLTGQLCLWALEDCPEKLASLPGGGSRRELEEMAANAGFLCDAGMINFFFMDAPFCRGLFDEEEALLQLHAFYGSDLLRRHPSTAIYADVAHGHHCRYDEKGGYPLAFPHRESPMAPMIYLTAVADALASAGDDLDTPFWPARDLEEVLSELQNESGGRYAPFAAGLVCSPERREALACSMERWREEDYRELFARRERLAKV